MLRRILLGVDGSGYSQVAQQYALEISAAHGGALTALYVIDQGVLSGPRVAVPGPTFIPIEVVTYEDYSVAQEEMRKKGRALLDSVIAAGKAVNVPVNDQLRIGFPDQVILKEARSHDLVVVGRKGNSDIKEETLGYTGEMLASNAAVPILLAPNKYTPIKHCLLAYDGSQQAVRAMRALRQLLEGSPWPVTVVVVHEKARTGESTGREAEDYLRAHDIKVDVLVKEGEPGKAIMEASEATGANILAMGAFGHRGLRELFWGSTTTRILAHSHMAVLVAH
ncbi:MAG: universal stress protein [bacterium]